MPNCTFVIGHKSPDLDSVAAAIAYARFLNHSGNTEKFVPAMAGELNRETAFVLEKFGFQKPETLNSGSGKELVLVDHNELSQAVEGIGEAKIVEVLDHHKIDFKFSEPIQFRTTPWGATCTIIAKMYWDEQIFPDKNLAGLMLSAILVDTVIMKSPTATDADLEIIEELAGIAGIADWRSFGMDIFKVRASVSESPVEEIIKSDFKDFNFKKGKFGIGQVETVDLADFHIKEIEILAALRKLKLEAGYHTVILFITDIINEGSKFFVSTEDVPGVTKALGKHLENNTAYVEGIVSRKKQVVPMFTAIFD